MQDCVVSALRSLEITKVSARQSSTNLNASPSLVECVIFADSVKGHALVIYMDNEEAHGSFIRGKYDKAIGAMLWSKFADLEVDFALLCWLE